MDVDDGFCVRLRGLPWTASPDDVLSFFSGCQIRGGQNGIYLTQSKEGRPSGHAFVEFMSEEDVQRALKKNKEHLGNRYIEVFRCKKSEMDWVVKRGGMDNNSMCDAIVRLRGLPFGCSKEEIAQFFSGLEIVPNGIMLPEDRLGRSTGEAFVQFASQAVAERALGKHKERIGHRYIEIFKSSLEEAHAVMGSAGRGGFRSMGRPGPYDRGDRFGGAGGGPMGMGFGGRGRGGRNMKGFYDDSDSYSGGSYGFGGRTGGGGHYGMMQNRGGRGHWVRMRGLPFQAREQDVFEFFAPLQPLRVEFDCNESGRPSGSANVEFATHDEAQKAMRKHKSNMQHRYIELFLNSTPDDGGSFSNSGMGMGGSYSGDNMGIGSSMMDSGAYGSAGGNMGGGYSSGMIGDGGSMTIGGAMIMGANYGGQEGGQFISSAQYSNNSNMGSSSYMGNGGGYMGNSGNGQGSSYGNQGYNMGGGGGGYSSTSDPNYMAF